MDCMTLSMLIILSVTMANPVQSDDCKNYCSSGGACLRTNEGPKCICYPEWTGKRCETRQVVAGLNKMPVSSADRAHLRTNLCDLLYPNYCKNDGICYVNDGIFACHCRYPFVGEYCEEESECFNYCLNNGICNIVGNLPRCSCMHGWEGARCQRRMTTTTATPVIIPNIPCEMLPRDHCKPGVCLFTTTAFCFCPATHTGDRCQIPVNQTTTNCSNDPNSSNPCKTTTSTTTSPPQSCTVTTCKNGGRCFNNGNMYYCHCRAPYIGRNCETLSG